MSEYTAVKLVDHTSRKTNNQKRPTAVFIDLSTFDTLSYIVLYKIKYYGVTENEFNLKAYDAYEKNIILR